MPSQNRDTLIPYGRAKIAPGDLGEPTVVIGAGVLLRLSDGPYPFPEPPDLIRIASTQERLELLREHLQSLCGVWDRPARLFLDAYFRFIGMAIAAGAAELTALAARTGGLFAPADWSFSALRPLPQAHLGAALIRVDFAFWTGAELVAIELKASASPRRQRLDELARLAAAGIAIVEVPGAALQQEGERLLAQLLPRPFQRFFAGVVLPTSPFGPELDVIRAAD